MYAALAVHLDSPTFDEDLRHSLLFGLGFFYFIVSMVPGALLRVLEAIGFVADRDKGVDYLMRVHRYGGVRGTHSHLFEEHLNIIIQTT